MKCPRTGDDLTVVKVGKIAIEISEKCGGVFFDNRELEAFDEQHEKRGKVLVDHLKQFTPPKLNLSERISCPKCESVVMARNYYSPRNQVEIDECPGCGGIWLDYGELEKLRRLFPTQQERQLAGQEFEQDFINSPTYKLYIKKLEDKEQLAERISRRRTQSSLISSFLAIFDN